jgi:hypothetical protein
VFVKKDALEEFYESARQAGMNLEAIGETVARKKHLVEVL